MEEIPGQRGVTGERGKGTVTSMAAEHPFCELCFERGVIVPTEEIHHKKPLSEGGTHDWSNLIALCKSCHSRIHAERGDRWGKSTEGGVKIPARIFSSWSSSVTSVSAKVVFTITFPILKQMDS